MPAIRKPIIDDRNPLYCPTTSPKTYVNYLERKLNLPFVPPRGLDTSYEPLLRSYSRKLFMIFNGIEVTTDLDLDTSFSQSQSSDILTRSKHPRYHPKPLQPHYRILNDSRNILDAKRKQKQKTVFYDDLGDMLIPPHNFVADKERSLYEENSSVTLAQFDFIPSFCNDIGPIPLEFTDQATIAPAELHGPVIRSETPRGLDILLNRILLLLPLPRLRILLDKQQIKSHQQIVDILAMEGLLSGEVLALFRDSQITRVSLTPSRLEENGLKLSSDVVLPVFSQPHSFSSLLDLVFNDTPLLDSDLVHISRLPKLSTLSLNNTSIGDEAVYLLVPLKHTLKYLSLAGNSDITDAVAPALCLFRHLEFLSILDTGISMIGMRKLAHGINGDGWGHPINIEIPTNCERYIENMEKLYMVNVTPVMATCPSDSNGLSAAALKFNLTMHAHCNPSIYTGGTKSEMAKRLKELLQTRMEDLVVRNLVCSDKSD